VPKKRADIRKPSRASKSADRRGKRK
jgi:hypothetical protein